MNVIMIQPSLSSQRLTGYWQEQAAGIYQKFYLSSQACSLRLVYCEMPAESFLFSQNCDNWHPAETLSPLSDPRLGHRTLHAVSSAAPHCRNLILCQTLISNHNHSEPLTNESQTWDVTCRTPRPSLCDHTSPSSDLGPSFPLWVCVIRLRLGMSWPLSQLFCPHRQLGTR